MNESQTILAGLGAIGFVGLIASFFFIAIGNIIVSLILLVGYKIFCRELSTPKLDFVRLRGEA